MSLCVCVCVAVLGLSLGAALGLSCLATCGMLVPLPGIKPVSPALEDRILTTEPPGKFLCPRA